MRESALTSLDVITEVDRGRTPFSAWWPWRSAPPRHEHLPMPPNWSWANSKTASPGSAIARGRVRPDATLFPS